MRTLVLFLISFLALPFAVAAAGTYSADVEYWCKPFERTTENYADMYWRVNDASRRFAAGDENAFTELIEGLREADEMRRKLGCL